MIKRSTDTWRARLATLRPSPTSHPLLTAWICESGTCSKCGRGETFVTAANEDHEIEPVRELAVLLLCGPCLVGTEYPTPGGPAGKLAAQVLAAFIIMLVLSGAALAQHRRSPQPRKEKPGGSTETTITIKPKATVIPPVRNAMPRMEFINANDDGSIYWLRDSKLAHFDPVTYKAFISAAYFPREPGWFSVYEVEISCLGLFRFNSF